MSPVQKYGPHGAAELGSLPATLQHEKKLRLRFGGRFQRSQAKGLLHKVLVRFGEHGGQTYFRSYADKK